MKIMAYAIGGIVGALVGYLYYRFVGCTSGQCLITSNPWSSMLYGVVLGVLIAGSFAK
ncbi:MAG TPA: DUF6132 family protein [Clostridia bacterium]|nr:DUF6132 family protein [Clostridia bacterium]